MELNKKRILAAIGVTTAATWRRPPQKVARSGEFRAKIGGHTRASAKVARSGEFRAKISGHIEAFRVWRYEPGSLVTKSPTTPMVKNGLFTPDQRGKSYCDKSYHEPSANRRRASVAMATTDVRGRKIKRLHATACRSHGESTTHIGRRRTTLTRA